MSTHDFICATCGKRHSGVPDLAFRRPDAILQLGDKPKAGGRARCVESDDACQISPSAQGDRGRYFVRAVLVIPLLDGPGEPPQEDFAFGPWAEVELEQFEATLHQQEGDVIEPFVGRLANELPRFPGSLGLSVMIDPGDGSDRPMVVCTVPNHALTAAQHNGLTVQEAMAMLHERL